MGIELCAGDRNFYYEVLKAFVETHFIDSLNTCLDTQDFKTYQVVVHGVKSSAKSIGAIPLSELALDLELALKERNDIEYIKNNHETIIFKIKEIEDIITSLLNS